MKGNRPYVWDFNKLDLSYVAIVGGKNASLGEMIKNLGSKGIQVPGGFAVSAQAYWDLLDENDIRFELTATLGELDTDHFSNLAEISRKAKELILHATMPDQLKEEIIKAYSALVGEGEHGYEVAVRSSATAEDLPNASFAGQQETYLNVTGDDALLEACMKCFASLFTERAIKYRVDHVLNIWM